MNFTPSSFRHDWNVFNDLKNAEVGSSLASGTVSSDPASVAPVGAACALAPSATSAAGRTAPFFVTFQPSGSWMSTWPAEMTFGAAFLVSLPQPATANAITNAPTTAARTTCSPNLSRAYPRVTRTLASNTAADLADSPAPTKRNQQIHDALCKEGSVRVGIHLPQYGPAAGPESIRRAAEHGEELGFADLWVSDHVVHPAEQDYPTPYLYDPLVTLTWAAACTTAIGLGTSVLIVPMHNPLELANALASLDALSGGRLLVGAGVGWSEAEYRALGYGFHDRGRRMDESLDLLRVAWRDDPVSFQGEFFSVHNVRVLPKPAHPIPIWVGGGSEAAYRRAVRAR